MPGTIQVSVLGFNGVQTPSTSSDAFIKVSMGKREYQTWDTGDFTFPVTTLREKLIVTLVDANGNDISYTEMETRLIIEKGFLEEKFSLEGGGNVHLKLQFVLSEEDRDRIRIVRQSALRKKYEELVNSKTAKPKTIASGSSLSNSQEVSDPGKTQKNTAADEQASPETNLGLCPETKFKTNANGEPGISSIPTLMTEQPRVISQRNLLEKMQNQSCSSEVSTSKELSEVRKSETAQFTKEDSGLSKLEKNESENLGKQSQSEKNLSNVREMISTFETGLTEDKKLQMAKIRTGSYTDEPNRKNAESRLKSTVNLKKSKERKNSSEDMQKSVYTNKQRRKRSPVSEGMDGKGVSLKNPNGNIHIAPRVSSAKPKNLVYIKDSAQHLNIRGSRLWIFPDGTKDSCIITSGTKHVDPAEAAAYQKKVDSSVRQSHLLELQSYSGDASSQICLCQNHVQRGSYGGKMNMSKNIQRPKKQRSEASAHSENSRGPVGQVMRALIMVGFATLVVLTRQRNQR